jgi:hypothetical protein
MNRITNKTVSVTGAGSTAGSGLMGTLVNALARSGILKKDFDYHLLRAAMVITLFLLWISEMVGV